MKTSKLQFVKSLKGDSASGISVSLYKDENNNYYVVKTWQNKYINLAYLNLLNEINSLKDLNNLKLNVPKIVEVNRGINRLSLITAYIDGRTLDKIKPYSTQLKIYNRLVNELRDNSGSFPNRHIRTKTVAYYLTLLPIIWIKAIFQNIGQLALLLKILPIYIHCSTSNIGNNNLDIVHGDLNFKNIIIKNKKTYIIDCEQTCLTYPEFETVSSLMVYHSPAKFKQSLKDQILIMSQSGTIQRYRLVFALLNCSLHNLTWYAPRKYVEWYFKLLHFAIKLYEKP